jgi:hypothetical protein
MARIEGESRMKRSKEEDAIMSRIANLKTELKRQNKLLEEERYRNAGIAIGDIVVSKGERFRVAQVKTFSYGSVWVIGNAKKKDGSWGTAPRQLYNDWTKEQA